MIYVKRLVCDESGIRIVLEGSSKAITDALSQLSAHGCRYQHRVERKGLSSVRFPYAEQVACVRSGKDIRVGIRLWESGTERVGVLVIAGGEMVIMDGGTTHVGPAFSHQ